MAFEIHEIAIQMHVADNLAHSNPVTRPLAAEVAENAIEREALVRECVRRVLIALKTQGER